MRAWNELVGGVLAMVLAVVPPAFADSAAKKNSGTVVAVEEEVLRIKGADGKTYEVEAESVVAEDLKTGDEVEYDLVEAKPVSVEKKAK